MDNQRQTDIADGTPAYLPFFESKQGDGAAALQAAMAERGYLFFRELLPAQTVRDVRADVLALCEEAGWLDPNRDLMGGFVRPGMEPTMEGKPEYTSVYRRVLKELPRFHDLPTHPHLVQIAADVLETEAGGVLVHPRRIGRLTFPNLISATTPAHQDHFYIRGSIATYSCWMPLGDCPVELGGLAVAAGSHRNGYHDHSETIPGATGGRGVKTAEEAEWHTADFRAGDALFFHSFTVHKALPNRTPDRIRLSTDNCYQRVGDAIDPSSLKPHMNL